MDEILRFANFISYEFCHVFILKLTTLYISSINKSDIHKLLEVKNVACGHHLINIKTVLYNNFNKFKFMITTKSTQICKTALLNFLSRWGLPQTAHNLGAQVEFLVCIGLFPWPLSPEQGSVVPLASCLRAFG